MNKNIFKHFKMLQLIFIVISTTLISCTKEISTDATSIQLSSNAVEHLPYEEIIVIDQIIPSTCTNEEIHMTGELIFKYNWIIREDGSFHFNGETRYNKITATGLTSGDKYVYIGSQSSINNGTETTGPFIVEGKFIFMNPSGGTKLISNTSIHVVTNANGEVVVENVEFSYDCE